MSHTTIINRIVFIYKGDYDGDIEIGHLHGGLRMTIPFDDLKEFVAEYIRDKRISKLEQMTTDQLLD